MPPHGHDFNQNVEHSIGCSKGTIEKEFNGYKGSVRNIRPAQVLRWAEEGGERYDAMSWHHNCLKWVQCLRIVAAPADKEITVYQYPRRQRGSDGELEPPGKPVPIVRRGTYGNYCYKDFS